jgi:hypothetical protein
MGQFLNNETPNQSIWGGKDAWTAASLQSRAAQGEESKVRGIFSPYSTTQKSVYIKSDYSSFTYCQYLGDDERSSV